VLPGERKSVEPMAAITAPERTAAQHQSLLHLVSTGKWSDDAVLGKVREMVLPKIERYGPIEAWIIDDTGIPKKGEHSVGVSHQHCGQLGKQANCQVAVTLSLANHDASLPVAYRLYLPKAWAEDDSRRRKAKVTEDNLLDDHGRRAPMAETHARYPNVVFRRLVASGAIRQTVPPRVTSTDPQSAPPRPCRGSAAAVQPTMRHGTKAATGHLPLCRKPGAVTGNRFAVSPRFSITCRHHWQGPVGRRWLRDRSRSRLKPKGSARCPTFSF
jgi:hypothetical protein